MSGNKLENLNVASQEALITPEALKKEIEDQVAGDPEIWEMGCGR